MVLPKFVLKSEIGQNLLHSTVLNGTLKLFLEVLGSFLCVGFTSVVSLISLSSKELASDQGSASSEESRLCSSLYSIYFFLPSLISIVTSVC